MMVITHYQRLLDYIVPDRVHVLAAAASSPKAARNWRLSLRPRATPMSRKRTHERRVASD